MLAWFEVIPVLVRVLLSLGVILALSRCFRELFWPIVLGVGVLSWLSGHGWAGSAAIAGNRLLCRDNLMLVAVILLVIWLSSQMAAAGLMRDLVEAVRRRASRRAAMAMLPAIIGLLPMPGGALFSAPMVDECDPERNLCALLKTQINYWFRHVWEFWWPLYPGVLLAVDLTGLEMWRFMLIQLPLSAISLGVGWLLLLRRLPAEALVVAAPGEVGEGDVVSGATWWRPLLPIGVVIGIYGASKALWPALAAWSGYLPMALGLLAAIALIQHWHPLSASAWRNLVLSRKTWGLVLIVEAVRVYGAFIEARLPGGMLLVEQMRDELAVAGIPVLAVVMVVPFLCGLTTGLAIGFVGASFPIVMNLVDPGTLGLGGFAAVCVLAYGFGYYGMMLSPVHVCLVVTNQHFQTCLMRSLRNLAWPAAVTLVGIGAYALLLNTLMGHGGASPAVIRQYPVMGTVAEVRLYGDKAVAELAADAVHKEFLAVERVCNVFDHESELSRLNAQATVGPVACGEMLWEVLLAARRCHEFSDGAFDVTAQPLMELWGFHRRRQELPSPEEIAITRELVGLELVEFDDATRSVRFRRPGIRLDLGGIAKGYAVDRAAAAAMAHGVVSGTINLGGNVFCLPQPPPGREHYVIGVRHPRRRDAICGRVILSGGMAMATSGDYERIVEIAGQRFTHIMDPATGMPVSGMLAVTVITPCAVDSDALSTAIFVRGPGLAQRAHEEIPGTRVLLLQESPDNLEEIEMRRFGLGWEDCRL